MIATKNGITIELESEEEITRLWNILMFAIEYHNDKAKRNEPCMTEGELNMAKKLVELTEKKW